MAGVANTTFRHLLAIIKSDDLPVSVQVGRTRLAVIDSEDLESIAAHKWRKRGKYAAALIDGRLVRMHNFILGNVPEGMVVDHINGDELDNRRANLRLCWPAENARNRRRAVNSPTKYKGVFSSPQGWRARIWLNGQMHVSEPFGRPITAAHAYDKMARRLHGEFAKTNADLGLY